MMGSSHLLASAAIGRGLSSSPWAAVAASFGFHFVLDSLPHLDSDDVWGETGPLALMIGVAVADFILAGTLLGFLLRGRPWRRTALWCALSAVVLDLLNTIPPIGPWFKSWRGTAWLDRWHHAIQPDVPPDAYLVGFGTQAIVIAISVWLLLRPARSPERE